MDNEVDKVKSQAAQSTAANVTLCSKAVPQYNIRCVAVNVKKRCDVILEMNEG